MNSFRGTLSNSSEVDLAPHIDNMFPADVYQIPVEPKVYPTAMYAARALLGPLHCFASVSLALRLDLPDYYSPKLEPWQTQPLEPQPKIPIKQH